MEFLKSPWNLIPGQGVNLPGVGKPPIETCINCFRTCSSDTNDDRKILPEFLSVHTIHQSTSYVLSVYQDHSMEREGKKEIFFPHTQQDTESWVSEVSGSTPGSHFPSWQIFLLESPRARVESLKKILQIMTPRGGMKHQGVSLKFK